jgi:hypothetical protein
MQSARHKLIYILITLEQDTLLLLLLLLPVPVPVQAHYKPDA